MTRTVRAILINALFLTLAAAGAPVASQEPQRPGESDVMVPVEKDPKTIELKNRQAKELNLKRQKDLKRDTDRLLQLATELKTQVDQSNEHVLSLTVIKKAEEIEKLARSVKNKMKGEH